MSQPSLPLLSIADASKELRAQLASLDADALEALVRKHNALYWDENKTEIDDPTFDVLLEALRRARPDSPALLELGPKKKAPVRGGGRGGLFHDVTHAVPMLSLDKCYDDETLLKWAAGIKGGFFVTPKIDGLACALRYDERGRLHQAATRGDGAVGDDITQNARGVQDIPQTLAHLDGVAGALEVRGEVYMRLSRFNALYKADKANPRNLAAGALKMKDPAESKSYGLSFFAYDLLGSTARSEHDKMTELQALGFPTLPHVVIQDAQELPSAFRAFIDTCKGLDTETDGVVIKALLVSEHQRLGATAHHPRAAIAYKFQGESAQTTVRDVVWSVARSGAVTPIAIVDPIFISGVTVTRVSLHNAGYAQKLGVNTGALVEVVRRGGVIPHVERVITKPAAALELPTTFASKAGALPIVRDADFLYLQDPERAPEVVADRVRHFTSVIDATGFGEKVLAQLVDRALVHTPADLYRLDKAMLSTLERMGDLSAQKLLDMMNARRELTLVTFLVALGIDEVGKTVAEKLVDSFHTLDAIRRATLDELLALHGVGPSIAEAVVRGMKEQAHVIDELLREVKIVEPQKVEDTGHALFGKSVVFTGTLSTMDRKSAQKRVQALGGKTPSSVTADLDFLVVGDEGSALLGTGEKSTKQKAAEKLVAKGAGVRIVGEAEFWKLVGP